MMQTFLLAIFLPFSSIASPLPSQAGPSSGYRVTGTVNPAETGTPDIPVPGIPGPVRASRGNLVRLSGTTDLGAVVDAGAGIGVDGTFEFINIPPGVYEVIVLSGIGAIAQNGPGGGRGNVNLAPVSLSGSRALPLNPAMILVKDRDVRVELGGSWMRVSGAVRVDGGGPVPAFDLEFQALTPGNEPDPLGRRIPVHAGAVFTADMPQGAYRIVPRGLPAGFSVRGVNQTTVDLTAQPFRVGPEIAAELVVTLGVATPAPWVRLSGKVAGGTQTTASWTRTVVLNGPVLAGPLAATVRPDGTFEFPRVLPGAYEARVRPSIADLSRVLSVGSAGLTDVTLTEPVPGDLVGEFVPIEPGVFMMGCPSTPCANNEQAQHRAAITKRFELGKYEVTQAQWEAVMGENPSNSKGATKPVEGVSWDAAQEFIARLNELDTRYRYRLPTEAEWEYAARAGSSAADPPAAQSDVHGWFNTNAGGESHPVGQKVPNAWGLHDMRGNVSEWIQDDYDDPYYYSNGVPPALLNSLLNNGPLHIPRGGTYAYVPDASRSTTRPLAVNARNTPTGIRLVREPLNGKAIK